VFDYLRLHLNETIADPRADNFIDRVVNNIFDMLARHKFVVSKIANDLWRYHRHQATYFVSAKCFDAIQIFSANHGVPPTLCAGDTSIAVSEICAKADQHSRFARTTEVESYDVRDFGMPILTGSRY